MNATEKLTALKRCEVLAAADDDALEWLSEAVDTEVFAAGDVVFETGEVSSRVYVVVSGSLEVRRNEDTAMVGFFEAGALFGEYATFVNGVRTARVVAREESVLLSMDDEHFRTFLLRSPEAMMLLLQTSVRRLNRASRQLG
jgi:CRP-like cAMP-binding protein